MATRRTLMLLALAGLQACALGEPSPEDRAKVHLDEGAAHLAQGRRAEALEAYTRAVETDPQSAEVYFRRGGTRLKRVLNGDCPDEASELERAVADLSQALGLYPMHFEASFNRGLAYSALSRYREAAQDLQQALQSGDASLRRQTHATLAQLLEEKFEGLETQALKHFERYAELGGRDPQLLARTETLRTRLPRGTQK